MLRPGQPVMAPGATLAPGTPSVSPRGHAGSDRPRRGGWLLWLVLSLLLAAIAGLSYQRDVADDFAVLPKATPLVAAEARCSKDPLCQGLSFRAAVPDTRTLEVVLKPSQIASPKAGHWSLAKPISASPAGTWAPRFPVRPARPPARNASGGGGGAPAVVTRLDITLVTQTSVDRVWMLRHLCDIWGGPVSAAIYVTGDLAGPTAEMKSSACAGKGGSTSFVQGSQSDQYPVNVLRNKAVQGVKTSHWMLIDVDLWPSDKAYATLRKAIQQSWALSPKTALIVPAFATRYRDPKQMPSTLKSLARCIGQRACYSFKGYPNAIPAHHLTTNYPHWWHQTFRPLGKAEVYKVPCFDTEVWEPYTLLPKAKTTPRFDERFDGYGKNKIQFILHLRMAGFAFYVVPRAFLMHAYHPPSSARAKWSSHKGKMDRLFGKFIREVSAVRDVKALPLCEKRLPQFVNMLKYSGDQREADPGGQTQKDNDMEEG
ncbi:glycosyl-transferase for dystroglycan-domain-containing protein [Pavlovales sp. CCMP2436]|nr:glycosyl-transferase for dystroglycan-domain-containing protein [Pavlovales sp. CCMP2436]